MSKISREKYIMNLLNDKYINDKNFSVEEKISGKTASQYESLLKRSKQLEKVYKFHSSIIHHLSSGLLIIDPHGNINFSNKAAQELLEYEYDELQDMPLLKLFKFENEGRGFVELLTMHDKNYRNKEVNFKKKSGSSIPVGLTTTSLSDEYNEYEGYIILFKDLTEIIKLKQQIERMDRLALLGELSAGIAHEIRNPLAGIKAAAQLLEETFEDSDSRGQLVQRIVKEIDKSNRLLKEFFKFAKPASPNLAYCDFENMVDGLFLLMGSRLRKQNIKYSVELESSLPGIFVDETQIEQVLLNVFLNAMDAMPEGGTLSIVAKKRSLTSFERDAIDKIFNHNQELQYVEVEITDTGKGIDNDNLNKVFDPFFTTKASGLGLGLSISTRLLEENLGKIDVKKSDSSGTTFVILLPCFHHE